MPWKNAPPGSGMGRRTHFPYVPTGRGSRWMAYCAGPCHWILGHEINRKTKVCPTWLTDGELHCEWCSPINGPIERGYQPVFRQSDSKPVLVMVGVEERTETDRLRFLARVIVAREKEASASLFIRLATDQEPKYQSTLPERGKPADVTHSMLALWGMPAVKAWWARKHGGSDSALSLPPGVAVTDAGDAYSPAMQAAAKRYGATVIPPGDDPTMYDEVYGRLRQKGAKLPPATNGNH